MVWISLSFVLVESTTSTIGWLRRRRRSHIHTIVLHREGVCGVFAFFPFSFSFSYGVVSHRQTATVEIPFVRCQSIGTEASERTSDQLKRDAKHQFAWCQRVNGKHKRLIVAYAAFVCESPFLFALDNRYIDWIYSVQGAHIRCENGSEK